MKNVLFIIAIMLLFQACGNQNSNNAADSKYNMSMASEIQADSIKRAYLTLDKKRYDFGKIKKSKTPQISVEFMVENQGTAPLVISKVDVSCGCLSAQYPQEPIPPGEKTKLTINIDTKSQKGIFNKTIFVKSNAVNDVILIRIVGEIK